MAFQKPKKLPQFSDLVSVLARSKGIDDALYQTVQEIINRLDQFIIASGGLGGGTGEGPQGPTGPPGPTPPLNETFITVNPEATLANHRQLIAGANITLNVATPNQIAISSSGGAGGGGMKYWGDYVPGTYNDGDIVIGPDGVAYVCTVDGTTTPPEPWPGVGVAVNETVDASYWVVSAHSKLTNERVLSALANGYVKSTGGEPSTVAIIPVAEGGTGANNPSNARTNLGVGTVGELFLNGNAGTFLNGSGNWSVPPIAGVPQRAVLFFDIPCPPGYTRVAAWDGYYVRMGPVHTAGGANTHQHGVGTYASVAHTHPAGTLSVPSHSHGAGTLAVDSHNHGNVTVGFGISGTTGGGGGHDHTFSGTTGGESAGQMNVDAGASGNMSRAPHTHGFSGTTANEANHTHSFSGSGSGSGATGNAAPAVNGTTSTQAAVTPTGSTGSGGGGAITGLSDAQPNLPLYVDFFACQKD
jgi:hypothetical protein